MVLVLANQLCPGYEPCEASAARDERQHGEERGGLHDWEGGVRQNRRLAPQQRQGGGLP